MCDPVEQNKTICHSDTDINRIKSIRFYFENVLILQRWYNRSAVTADSGRLVLGIKRALQSTRQTQGSGTKCGTQCVKT